jgi:hypothetical protein
MLDPIALARTRSLPALRRSVSRGWPRLAVGGMIALTTLSGFLCSVALLHLGVGGMGVRYAISVLVAYAVFLAQLWLWVALARRSGLGRDPGPDIPDLSGLPDVELPAPWQGGGGHFAGGGASGGWSGAGEPGIATHAASGAADAAGGLDLDLDGWPILAAAVLLLLVASGAIAAGYLVYTAPSLLAEVFFDGVVAGVLYRRLRRGSERAWWHGALSRTWVPALVVFLLFGIGGRVLDELVPGADSIGGVVRGVMAGENGLRRPP